VKLARALWIVPVSLLAAVVMARLAAGAGVKGEAKAKVKVPWFIAFFCLAAAVNTYVPRFATEYRGLDHLGKAGLTATLFLIGTSLSWRTIRQVGARPLVQGIALWVVVATCSLFAIYFHYISI
jgi:uncharacterized membrane protein YadS